MVTKNRKSYVYPKYKNLNIHCCSIPYAENIPHAIIIRKHSLILDLNGVLLSKVERGNFDTNRDTIDIGRSTIALRPGCFEFLDKLCQYFHVGIWSTMLHRNVCAYLNALENKARKRYNFFMVWGQEVCYIHNLRRVYRPDKPYVEAMFKPLLRVWYQHKDVCNVKNTLLIDDSPFKGCINPKDNCLYPLSYQGESDAFLCNELLPYLIALNNTDDIRTIISFNRLGQPPITEQHGLFSQFDDIIEEWLQFTFQFLREELHDNSNEVESSSCASSHLPWKDRKMDYIQARGGQREGDSISKEPTIPKSKFGVQSLCDKKMYFAQAKVGWKEQDFTRKEPSMLASEFGVPLLSPHQLAMLKMALNTKNLSDRHAIAYATCLGYDRGPLISGVAAKAYLSQLQRAYMSLWVGKTLILCELDRDMLKAAL